MDSVSVCKGGTRLDTGGPGGPPICPSGREEVHRSRVSLLIYFGRDPDYLLLWYLPGWRGIYRRLSCVHLRDAVHENTNMLTLEKTHPYQYVWCPSINDLVVIWPLTLHTLTMGRVKLG